MLLGQKQNRQRRVAFTLMEMLVVVAIIVALAGIGGFFLIGAFGGAQKDTARAQVKGALTTACQSYYLKHNQWPSSLQQLTQPDEFKQIYLESTDSLVDPWGKQYQYNQAGTRNNGMKPDIYTTAPDGEQIGNWAKGH